MPFSAFTARLRTDQLRTDPTSSHTSSALDGYAPTMTSGDPPAVNAPNTFPLVDGVELELSIGGVDTTVAFDTADFVDITEATAAEVAAVLDGVAGLVATVAGFRVRLSTTAVGPSASLQVGGDANGALVFPTALVRGTTGTATMVLGHDRPGFEEMLGDGDFVQVEQETDLDESTIRLVGEARIPEIPSGSSWRLSLLVDGDEAIGREWGPGDEGTYSLDEFGFSAANQNGSNIVVVVVLTFSTTSPDPILVELPGVYLDRVRSTDAVVPVLLNRIPAPSETGFDVAGGAVLTLDISSTVAGSAITAASTVVRVDGVIAYNGATNTFLNGWNGVGSLATFGEIYNTGSGAFDARIVLASNALTFISEQLITVRVVAAHAGGGTSIDESWTFTTADTLELAVLGAQARDALTVRIEFNDDLDEALALEPSNYAFEVLTSPAVTITASSVVMVGTDAVDVTLDIEMSQGASYTVTVLNLTDEVGNALDEDEVSAAFTGFLPDVPAGRDFQLWDFVPGMNRRMDRTGDLRSWIYILQDVTDLLLTKVDRWVDIFDIDRAPETFVDAMLSDLGNPFNFVELSLIDKRRLGRILVDVYKTKGTALGVIDAVRFLTGVEITLEVINYSNDFWVLGVSALGIDTGLAPPSGDGLWYSFWIDSATTLSDEQRDVILKVATYMKPAHEHILGIRDPSTVTPTTQGYWVLGESALSIDTTLGD